LQQSFDFFGYYAPIIQFQRPHVIQNRSVELASPVVYSTLDFTQSNSGEIHWQGDIVLCKDGTVNALRFITKNILAVLENPGSTIDWLIDYLVLPLAEKVEGKAGDTVHIKFHYQAGESIRMLEQRLSATLQMEKRC
jgi:hypothetical protein